MCSPDLMGDPDEPVDHELMGRLVVVTLDFGPPLHYTIGWLESLDAGGAVGLADSEGKVTYSWPALRIEPLADHPDTVLDAASPRRPTETVDPGPYL